MNLIRGIRYAHGLQIRRGKYEEEKITAILMASLMVLGCFTGCGKTEGQKTDTSGTEKEVETVTDAEEEKRRRKAAGM